MTTNKALSTPANNSSSWDTPLNGNFNNIDAAFGGTQSFNLAAVSGNVGVTGTTYVGAYPANTPSYVPLIFLLSGALSGNTVLQIPNGVGGQWVVNNGTSGAFTITIAHASGGTSTVIPQGTTRSIYSDGTNIAFADSQTTTAGSTSQVIYNSGGSLIGSANLTFDGTTLTANALTVTGAATVGSLSTAGSITIGGVAAIAVAPGASGNVLTSTGTGWSSAAGIPSASGKSGQYLTNNGSSTSWGNVFFARGTITGGTTTVNNSLNVASITNPSQGQYTVVFTSAASNSNYQVIVALHNFGGGAFCPMITSKSTTGFSFNSFQTASGGYYDMTSYSFLVIGG